MLYWLNQNAGALQAICAFAGLFGLLYYCRLTLGIWRSTVAQQKAGQAPMLVVVRSDDSSYWHIKNFGAGPAAEVWWKPGCKNESSEWVSLGALAPNDTSEFPHHSRPDDCRLHKMYDDGLRIHYSDMAGNHYATWGSWLDDAFIQTWNEIKKSDRKEQPQKKKE